MNCIIKRQIEISTETDLGPFAVVQATESGEVAACNAQALALLNLQRRSIIGSKIIDVLTNWSNSSHNTFEIQNLQTANDAKLMVIGSRQPTDSGFTYIFADLKVLSEGIDQLARRESTWNHALDSAGLGVWEFDRTRPENQQAYYSPQWSRMRGLSEDEKSLEDFNAWVLNIHPDDIEEVRSQKFLLNNGQSNEINYEYREKVKSGEWRWMMARGKVLGRARDGTPIHYVGTDVDITEIKNAELRKTAELDIVHSNNINFLKREKDKAKKAQKIAEDNAFREQIWRGAAYAAGYGVWSYEVDHSGDAPVTKLIFVSDTWYKIRGVAVGDQKIHDYDYWQTILHPDDRETLSTAVNNQINGLTDNFSTEFRELKPNGEYVWIMARGHVAEYDELGRPKRIAGTDVDITAIKLEEQRRAHEANLVYENHLLELRNANLLAEEAKRDAQKLARMDVATGLANRRRFREKVSAMISQSRPFAIFQIDLDKFKQVNDRHGHAAGDHVLRNAAKRLAEAVNQKGLCARLGGDEFAVAVKLRSKDPETEIQLIGNRIITAISQPIVLGDLRLSVGASVGASKFPNDGGNYDTLLQRADLALYQVKSGTRGDLRVFDQSLDEAAIEKSALEADIKLAIINDDIEPWFQPIVCAKTNAVGKFEVLARWKCKQRGFVSPEKFIAIAHDVGMLPQLTANIMRKALNAAISWKDVKLTFNISASEACDEATPLRIMNVLLKSGFPQHNLEIEITEQALISDFEKVSQVLAALRSAGIKILIDDFGQGYAGIGYLRDLDVDGIKFDRSCVKDICIDPRAATFLESLQGMADKLKYVTVAEGIETADVWAKVREIGCQFGQGYLFAKPMPALDVEAMLNVLRPANHGKVLAFSRT